MSELDDSKKNFPEPQLSPHSSLPLPGPFTEPLNSEPLNRGLLNEHLNGPSHAEIQMQIEEMELQSAQFLEHEELFLDQSNRPLRKDDASTIVSSSSLVLSTLLSLAAVLVLLIAVRLVLPPLLEWSRYSWHRGQLRAEYEIAGEQLQQVSLKGPWQISSTVSHRVSPSVVHINLGVYREPAVAMSLGMLERSMRGQGSGVVVDRLGHIITNYHVLDGQQEIEVTLSDGQRLQANVVGFDEKTDLAVLHVTTSQLFPIDWGNSDDVEVGDPLWAIGSPYGLTGSVTFGILSGKHRVDLSETRYAAHRGSQAHYADLMQTDAALNPGNSGGPLVNAKGELVGINTAILGEHYRGVCFAIPANVAKRVYEKILTTGRMERGILGVLLPDWLRLGSKRPDGESQAVVVLGFPAASAAKAAGMQIGDIIVAVNGRKVTDWYALLRIVGEADVSSTAAVEVLREGNPITLQIPIKSRMNLSLPN